MKTFGSSEPIVRLSLLKSIQIDNQVSTGST